MVQSKASRWRAMDRVTDRPTDRQGDSYIAPTTGGGGVKLYLPAGLNCTLENMFENETLTGQKQIPYFLKNVQTFLVSI